MRSRTLVLSCLSLLALGPAPGADVLAPVSQTRSVSGTAFASDESGDETDSDADQAADFGPFVAAAGVTVFVDNAPGSGGGTQNSLIRGNTIFASGSSFANGEGYTPEAFGSGCGSSAFAVTFDLSAPCAYSLSGFVEAFDNGGTSLSLRCGVTTIFGAGAGNEQVIIDQTGVLSAGRYTLTADSSGSAAGGAGFFDYASGAFEVTFEMTPLLPNRVRPNAAETPVDAGTIVLIPGSPPFLLGPAWRRLLLESRRR